MLAHLDDPSIKNTLDISELDKAKQVLLDKGGLGRLVMNLTGSGGVEKALFLMQPNLFANNFAGLLGNHSMILFL
jgi:hypothetical protein